MTFGNLLGFWALLGIPAVLLIHFLQRRSRIMVISTLFLLDQMQRESVSGNRVERLRVSVPLWLQLLAVILLTWLLVQPRWINSEAVQRVAIVLDSSASMSVFKEAAAQQISTALDDLDSLVTTTEYMLLETRASTGLFSGTDRGKLMQSVENWAPYSGTLDPTPALRVARSTVGNSGLVIFVTDQAATDALPHDAQLLAVGSHQENCGFAGFTVETSDDGQPQWRVLAKNYGTQSQTRQWWLMSGDQRTTPVAFTLAPGKAIPLQGPFPDGTTSCTLEMQGDAFSFDDQLPMVLPQPKQLNIWIAPESGAPPTGEFYQQVFQSFDNVWIDTSRTNADIEIITYDPLDPQLPDRSACVFARDPRQRSGFLKGQIVAAGNPLIEGINWQGLLCRKSIPIPHRDSDDVLLWQGDRPLIFGRRIGSQRQLYFNFDLQKSNAQRLPAFAVLLHRFLAIVREEKIALEAGNFEVGQRIELAIRQSPDATPLSIRSNHPAATQEIALDRSTTLRAPSKAGHFEILQGDQTLLTAAAHFADVREADFHLASSANTLANARAAIIERQSHTDGHWRLWLLSLLAALLLSWRFAGKKSTAARLQQSSAFLIFSMTLLISGSLPHSEAAEIIDGSATEICFYRGCQVDSVNHPTAMYQMNCGNRFGGDPALGSWVTYGLGSANQDLPGFIILPEASYPQGGSANWGNGYLPAHYQGTTLHPTGSPILDLRSPNGVVKSCIRCQEGIPQRDENTQATA
ncbi:MAG: hypothetical protein ACI9R3_004128 [Verrucomicrobiales bacterium]|jgi:hypothetical protein